MSRFLFIIRLKFTGCKLSVTSVVPKITHASIDYNDDTIITALRDDYATSSIFVTQKNKETEFNTKGSFIKESSFQK